MQILRSSSALKRFALLLTLLAPAILAACAPGGDQSTFDSAGPIAKDQENIFIFIFWLAVVVFVVVEAALIYSIFRFRQTRPDAEMPTQTHGNFKLEIAWTIAPVFVLVAIAVPTVTLIFDHEKGPVDGRVPENPLEINAVAHQWWFEFEYPGQDVITANELHIPIDRAVRVSLDSDDVIHSFWVPKLAGKVDMIPGDDNVMFIQADRVGTFIGQCAEFCGEAHANMRFRVVSHEPDDYEDWLDSMRRAPAPIVDNPLAEAGRTLFAQNCSTCHSTRTYEPLRAQGEREVQLGRQTLFRKAVKRDEEGIKTREGDLVTLISAPNLTHLAARQTFAAGIIELTEENLKKWIRDPDDIKQGNRMKDLAPIYNDPALWLSDEEVDQLAAYLMTLKPGPEEAVETAGTVEVDPIAQGREVFLNNGCSACHSTGADRVVGPGLSGLADKSSTDMIRESITDPGAVVTDGFPDGVMPGNFGSVISDNDLNALIQYLETLK
ncbi:MAG: cytochrome c oxidase subunit II [Chloroflexi bacterium]|nr:cytochrome c oxidase subunit II [Chloroflexota bacterium]